MIKITNSDAIIVHVNVDHIISVTPADNPEYRSVVLLSNGEEILAKAEAQRVATAVRSWMKARQG